MDSEYDSVMAKRTDAELLQIVQGPPDDYQPAALEAAKREFGKRNLSKQQVDEISEQIEQKSRIEDAKANEPLPVILKILAFIFPGIIQIILGGIYKVEGYTKKFSDLVKWTLYGFFFYGGIAVLILILTEVFHL